MTEFLSYDDVLRIHYQLVEFFASDGDPITPPGPRDTNLLHSACMRPQTSLGEIEKYRGIDKKAAALLHSLVMNHAFHNGNKRTALASMVSFLDRNDRRIDATDDELFDLVTCTRRASQSRASKFGRRLR